MSSLFLPPKKFAQIVGLENWVRYRGKRFYQMDPNDILKGYDFIPMGSSTTAVKELRMQQVLQAFQMFNQDPFINQIELRKMVMNALDMKNIAKLIKPMPAPSPAEQVPGPPGGGPPPPGMGPPPGIAGELMGAGVVSPGGAPLGPGPRPRELPPPQGRR